MTRSNVRSIGCHTRNWQQAVSVRRLVKASVRRNPALQRFIDDALARHARTIPDVMKRGTDHATPIDLQALHFPERCYLITLCTERGRLHTIVALESDIW